MDRSVVHLALYDRQMVATIVPDRYELNKRGRMVWLQRGLFWMLRKLRAYSYEDQVKYSQVEVDTRDIATAIAKNQYNAEMVWNQRAKYVVMGPKAFSELASKAPSRDWFNFPVAIEFGRNCEMKCLGLTCVVVPWIEGFFVMPELPPAK